MDRAQHPQRPETKGAGLEPEVPKMAMYHSRSEPSGGQSEAEEWVSLSGARLNSNQ